VDVVGAGPPGARECEGTGTAQGGVKGRGDERDEPGPAGRKVRREQQLLEVDVGARADGGNPRELRKRVWRRPEFPPRCRLEVEPEIGAPGWGQGASGGTWDPLGTRARPTE
jgi:hypothetical protein